MTLGNIEFEIIWQLLKDYYFSHLLNFIISHVWSVLDFPRMDISPKPVFLNSDVSVVFQWAPQ